MKAKKKIGLKRGLKRMAALLCAAAITAAVPFAAYADTERQTGDVNDDGVVNSVDALMILRYTAALQTLTGDSLTYADVNSDGEVNSVDALIALRLSAGLSGDVGNVAATSLSLSASSAALKVGDTYTLTPTTTGGYYASLNRLEWSSSSSYVATVTQNSDGTATVTPMSQGTAVITVKTQDGLSASCTVTVSGSTVKCLDVSVWQGEIDFDDVKAAGYNYVIIRAGYGRYTSQKDKYFETNYANAKAAGLKVGVYWFSYATDADDALLEAAACLACLNGKELDMPVYYDVELEDHQNMSKSDLTDMVEAFCDEIEDNGYRAGVFSFLNLFQATLDYSTLSAKYSIWLSQWSGSYSLDCDAWQYTDSASVSGITGDVDCSYILNLNIVQ